MKTMDYHFNGNTYVCRIVQASNGDELVIAPINLLEALQSECISVKNNSEESKEAQNICNDVFMFIDAEILALPEEQFIKELKKDNQESFD